MHKARDSRPRSQKIFAHSPSLDGVRRSCTRVCALLPAGGRATHGTFGSSAKHVADADGESTPQAGRLLGAVPLAVPPAGTSEGTVLIKEHVLAWDADRPPASALESPHQERSSAVMLSGLKV
jgi:hypothetical protein